jgi:hypothetical protein
MSRTSSAKSNTNSSAPAAHFVTRDAKDHAIVALLASAPSAGNNASRAPPIASAHGTAPACRMGMQDDPPVPELVAKSAPRLLTRVQWSRKRVGRLLLVVDGQGLLTAR